MEEDKKSNILDVNLEVVNYLRKQRHDFMNSIQVIWGYLQLNKIDNATEFIYDLNTRFNVYGKIFKIEYPFLALLFYNKINKVYDSDIYVDIDIAKDCKFDVLYGYDFDKLYILEDYIDKAIYEIIKNNSKKLFINIYNIEQRLYIEISNKYIDYINIDNFIIYNVNEYLMKINYNTNVDTVIFQAVFEKQK